MAPRCLVFVGSPATAVSLCAPDLLVMFTFVPAPAGPFGLIPFTAMPRTGTESGRASGRAGPVDRPPRDAADDGDPAPARASTSVATQDSNTPLLIEDLLLTPPQLDTLGWPPAGARRTTNPQPPFLARVAADPA